MLFDVLELNNLDLTGEPWWMRREKLERKVLKTSVKQYRISKIYSDWKQLWNDTVRQGLEGIMAKDVNAPYFAGKRRWAWVKIKVLFTEDVLVTGFTEGTGKRFLFFGSLIITDPFGESLGNVGTGFTDAELREYMTMFRENGVTDLGKGLYKLKTPIPAEVRHMERTVHGALREPVFMRFRTED